VPLPGSSTGRIWFETNTFTPNAALARAAAVAAGAWSGTAIAAALMLSKGAC
jgi:hypothetical protein